MLAHIRKLFEAEKIPFPRVIVTDRELALTNAIDKVFTDQPCGRIYRLLCCWHVNQNILGHAKKHFRVGLNNKDEDVKKQYDAFMNDWKLVLRSPTISDFDSNWASFQKHHPVSLVKYVRDTWIEPHKARIIWAWVNIVPHFGHHASSRVEGSHHAVKEYIMTSTGDLYITFQHLQRFWKAQHDGWEACLGDAKGRLPVSVKNKSRYIELTDIVSIFALNRIRAEWNSMKKERCSAKCPTECSYQTSWGLPCRHRLRFYKDLETPIALSEIHPHWLYDRSCVQTASRIKKYLKEPEVILRRRHANKITHQRGSGKNSTRRDSTWTERIERSQRQHGQRVAGVAKAPQDDQHTVYTTGAGPVVGSGSAAPKKRLPIRTPECSPRSSKKPKESCSASQALDDWYDAQSDVEREFAELFQ